jgi:hypothetical protein
MSQLAALSSSCEVERWAMLMTALGESILSIETVHATN